MILGLIWLLCSLSLGLHLLLCFGYPTLSAIECLVGATPLGFAAASIITYVVAGAHGGLTEHALLSALVVMALVTLALLLSSVRGLSRRRALLLSELQPGNWWRVGLVLGVSFVAFAYLLGKHSLYEYQGAMYSGGATWADMAIHLDIARSFVSGANARLSLTSWPQSPIYAGETLVYAFMPDFHAAVLLLGGWSERHSLLLPSCLLGMSLFAALLLLHGRLFRHRDEHAVALTAVVLFGLSGGLGWYEWLSQHGGSLAALEHFDFVERVSHDPRTNIVWFATLPHVLLPQRGALFAYPLVLLTMIALAALFSNNLHTVSMRRHCNTVAVAALCTALLPLLQTHAFVASFLFLASFVLYRPLEALSGKPLLGWITFLIVVLTVSTPQLTLFLSRASGGNFIKWDALWNGDHVASTVAEQLVGNASGASAWWSTWLIEPSVFYGRALGLTVPMALLAWLYLESPLQRRFYFSSWSIFVCASLIRFQPWKNDNIKLHYVWLLVHVGMIAAVLCSWASMRRRRTRSPSPPPPPHGHERVPLATVLKATFAAAVFVMLIGSGTLALIRESQQAHVFLSASDIELGMWARTNIDPASVVIASNRHNHPVSTLGGKTLLYGYDGWLYSHGYPELDRRRADQDAMLAGTPSGMALLVRHNVRYVVLDSMMTNFNLNRYRARARLVFDNAAFKVYDLFPELERVRPSSFAAKEQPPPGSKKKRMARGTVLPRPPSSDVDAGAAGAAVDSLEQL